MKKQSIFSFLNVDRPHDTQKWRMIEDSSGTEWELDKKINVRGHWRWQLFGQKQLKRKLIWICDYIKGKGEFEKNTNERFSMIN